MIGLFVWWSTRAEIAFGGHVVGRFLRLLAVADVGRGSDGGAVAFAAAPRGRVPVVGSPRAGAVPSVGAVLGLVSDAERGVAVLDDRLVVAGLLSVDGPRLE